MPKSFGYVLGVLLTFSAVAACGTSLNAADPGRGREAQRKPQPDLSLPSPDEAARWVAQRRKGWSRPPQGCEGQITRDLAASPLYKAVLAAGIPPRNPDRPVKRQLPAREINAAPPPLLPSPPPIDVAPLTTRSNLFDVPAPVLSPKPPPDEESTSVPKRLPSRLDAPLAIIEAPGESQPPRRVPRPLKAEPLSRPDPRPASLHRRVRPAAFQDELNLPDELDSARIPAPGPPPRLKLPLNDPSGLGEIELTPAEEGRISLVVRDAPLNEVLSILATQQGVNIVAGAEVSARITVTLHDVTLENALSAITAVGGYSWYSRNGIILVTSLEGAKMSPDAQGRCVQVFNLNFVAAADVEAVARGLISPSGKLFTTLTKPDDNRRTQEILVIEDIPMYVARVADYIAQVDCPPRQVMIEGHVLQVTLKDDTRHGVNWNALAKTFGGTMTLGTLGLATEGASPGSFLSFDGEKIDALVEALKSTTDAKTLAQPRVMVLNGQEARIQIGSRFGYLVTTTTQTSTLQNVNFLDVGVLLTVCPHISTDNRVLLSVKPEVSSGQINPVTNLPEQDTTEVETTVMLPDGQGIVIGGLIKEGDSDKQSKVPILGDLWLAGRFFQKRNMLRERTEIVIVLIPRVLPYPEDYASRDAHDYMKTTTPILHHDLEPVARPWEGQIPDAMKNPRRLNFKRVPEIFTNLFEPFPRPPEYYFPAVLEVDPWRREQSEFEAER